MTDDQNTDLQRDLFADSAGRLRRQLRARRLRGYSALATILLAGSITLATFRVAPTPQLAQPSPPAESPARAPTPGPAYETLTDDARLMAELADQGSMLITHADGRKQLILTRPR